MANPLIVDNPREYQTWLRMKDRCNNPKTPKYNVYGGRGIVVSPLWNNNFPEFFKHVGKRPDGMSIDRIDVNGNYEPGNVRWATSHQQIRNKTDNVFITFNGKTQIMKDWAREIGIPNGTLWHRITKKKWPIEKALTEPLMSSRSAAMRGHKIRWGHEG